MDGFLHNIEYPIFCFMELKKQFPKLSISAHKIIKEDDYDQEDLLS